MLSMPLWKWWNISCRSSAWMAFIFMYHKRINNSKKNQNKYIIKEHIKWISSDLWIQNWLKIIDLGDNKLSLISNEVIISKHQVAYQRHLSNSVPYSALRAEARYDYTNIWEPILTRREAHYLWLLSRGFFFWSDLNHLTTCFLNRFPFVTNNNCSFFFLLQSPVLSLFSDRKKKMI